MTEFIGRPTFRGLNGLLGGIVSEVKYLSQTSNPTPVRVTLNEGRGIRTTTEMRLEYRELIAKSEALNVEGNMKLQLLSLGVRALAHAMGDASNVEGELVPARPVLDVDLTAALGATVSDGREYNYSPDVCAELDRLLAEGVKRRVRADRDHSKKRKDYGYRDARMIDLSEAQ